MSALIVHSGPAASGKTTAAREWVLEDPGNRVIAGSAQAARAALDMGLDVILDLEGGEAVPSGPLYGLSYSVRHFAAPPTFSPLIR